VTEQDVAKLIAELVELWPYNLDQVGGEIVGHAYETIVSSGRPSEEITDCRDILSKSLTAALRRKTAEQLNAWAQGADPASADKHFGSAVSAVLQITPHLDTEQARGLLVSICHWAKSAAAIAQASHRSEEMAGPPQSEFEWQTQYLGQMIAEAKGKLEAPPGRLRNSLLSE
jgi:hypothetical protein